MSAEKTIAKALAVIDKKIDRLLLKRGEVKNRWPYDLYGTKADGKLDAIDEEIKALKDWRAERINAAELRQELGKAKAQTRHTEVVLFDALRELSLYDPQKMDTLRRRYLTADDKRRAGL